MTLHKKGAARIRAFSAFLLKKQAKIGSLLLIFICSVVLAFGGIFPAKTAGAMQSGVSYSQINEIWNDTSGKFNTDTLLQLFNQLAGSDYTAATDPMSALENITKRLDVSKNNSSQTQSIHSTAASHYSKQVTSKSIASKNGNKDIVVTFGGKQWTVTYLSYTIDGDPIATLWLANPEGTSRWSDYWYTNYKITNMTKQSNLYGQSYIRSETLNAGSRYTTVAGASASNIKADITSDSSVTWVNNEQSYENTFAKFTIENGATVKNNAGANEKIFTGSLTEFLETPRNVAWQKDQSWHTFGNVDYSLGNESWDDPYVVPGVAGSSYGAGETWFHYYNSTNGDFRRAYGRTTDSDGDGYGDGQTPNNSGKYKIQYTDWADDYLWLPSLSETGYRNNAGTNLSRIGGVWDPSQAQRKCFGGTNDSFSSTDSSWLRSGRFDVADIANALSASGDYAWPLVSSVAAVRPALHLNLKSAASAAKGFDIPSETSATLTYTGAEIKALKDVRAGIKVEKVEFTRTDRAGTPDTTTLSSDKYAVKADGGLYVTNAGEYKVTFKLDESYKIWDGTSVNGYGNPCDPDNPWAGDVIFWEITPPPSAPGGSTDPRITNKVVTFTINKAESKVNNVALETPTTLYDDGDLPALTHAGTASAPDTAGKVSIDSTEVLKHDKTTYKWTFVPDDSYNFKDKTGTINLTVKFPLLNVLTATFDVDEYNAAVEAGTAQKIYSSTPIANLKGIIQDFVTVSGKKQDGKPYTDPISYVLSLQAGKTKLDYGSCTVVLSYQDTHMTGAVSCDLSGIPVIAVELTKITVSGAFKNVYNAYESFDVTDMAVTAHFNDGSTSTVASTDYALEYVDETRSKFWASDTKIKVKYTYLNEKGTNNEASADVSVTVKKINYAGLKFEDSTVDYDGSEHSITVAGLVDGKMTVAYAYDGITLTGRTNVGTYAVTASVTFTDSELLTNYNPLAVMTATLKIEGVDYDNLTDISFIDATAEFNGQSLADKIKVTGLPEGVTVKYTFADASGNPVAAADVKAVADYTVTATFTVDANHKDIPAKTATLTITQKTLLINNLSGIESEYAYKGTAWTVPEPIIKVVLGTDAIPTNLVKDTDYTVAYSTEDGSAGNTVVVTVTGKGNYKGTFTKSFTIKKATLSLTWNAGNPQYDGNAHPAALEVTGGVQAGDAIDTAALAAYITVTYGKQGGVALPSGAKPTEVGVYTPSFADFPTAAPFNNYDYVITNAGYTYEISTATITGIDFEDLTVTFDGKNHAPVISGSALPADVTPEYYYKGTSDLFTGKTDAGVYEVTVKFVSASGNYAAPADMHATLTIERKEIVAGDITGLDSEYVYKGEAWKPLPVVSVALGTDTSKTIIVRGRDYNVSYDTEAYSAGTTVTVTIEGTGNYKGTLTHSFEIVKATLGVDFAGTDKTFTYNGTAQGVTAALTGLAASDKDLVTPTVKYVSVDGTTYPESENLPVNAGSYVIKVTLDASFSNYETFTERTYNFEIKKATPIVQVGFDTYAPDTDEIYAGGYLPDLKVVSAAFAGVSVTGSVDWQLVEGKKPLLTTVLTAYTWVFTPVGDDAVNFNETTGIISLIGKVPGIAGITVEWKTDINPVPTIYTSTSLDDLRKYLSVKAVLENGMPADDEIEDYSIKGSWGEGLKPALNETAVYNLTVLSSNGKSAVLEGVQYVKVELIGLEVAASATATGGITKTYDALSEFDRSSITVTALYNDGSKVKDITDYEIKYAVEGETVLWAGNTYVTVTYKDGTVANAKEVLIDGLTVNSINYDLTGVEFKDKNVPYDGKAHTLTVTGLPATGMKIEYTYDGVALADGVTGKTEAGSYVVGVTVTYTDDKYIINYNALTFTDKTLTIEQIDYDGVDGITFEDVSTDYDYGNSLAGELVATNVPDGVTVSYTYAMADGTAITADDIVNAGTYKVTVTFTGDANHKAIPSSTKTLTVNRIDPTINPTVSRAIQGQLIIVAKLNPKEGDTAGTYKWVDETYVLKLSNNQQYTFTPDDTVNYNTVTRSIVFAAETKVLTAIKVKFTQGDTKLYTSYTIDDVKKLIEDGEIGIEIIAVYHDGESSTNEEITSGYELYLPGGKTHLTVGDCAIGVKYQTETNELQELKVTEVELESITATFDQKSVKIYSTPDDIETLKSLIANGTVSLKVTGTNNDGKPSTETFAYTLSGDWSAMTTDGTFAVTVTVDGKTISTTFDVNITAAAVSSIKVTFDQKDAKIFTSTTLDGFKDLIANGDVTFEVKAYFNNGKSVVLAAKTDSADGYTLAIDGATFTIGGNVNVSYDVDGTAYTATVMPVVTAVVVDSISATVNSGVNIYTDTVLTDLASKITVIATRNDGTTFTVDVADYSLSLPDGATKLTAGAQKVILVTYNGADKAADCEDYKLITGVSKHATQIVYGGKTEFTYTGSEQVINSGATTTNTQSPKITYTINGADAKFTDVPASGELTLKISVEETDDFYAAEISVTLTVKKADVDMSAVKFEDQKFEYKQGVSQSLTIDASKLPAGVTVKEYVYVDTSDGSTITGTSVTNAGEYKVTVKFDVTSTDNYNPVADMTATLTIEKAAYDMTGVTFEDATFGYDGTAKTITLDDTKLPAGVTVKEYVYHNNGTGVKGASATDAGEYKVTVSFDIADSVNYKAVDDMTATLTITKAQSQLDVSSIQTEYTYDGLSHTVDGAVIVNGETGAVIEYSSNRTFTDVPAGGKLVVTVELKDSTNYIGVKETVTITVNKASLTITAKDKTIFYGDAPANDGINDPVGFVNGEDVTALKGAATFTYDYALGGNVGDYKITVGGYTSGNYDITFIQGTLSVLKKSVKVDWTVDAYVYDGKPHAPTATFTSIHGDKLSMTVTVEEKDGSALSGLPYDAGDYTATASSTNANYKFTDVTKDFTIGKANITVTGTGDQFYLSDADKDISLDVTESGVYKFIILKGNVVSATIYYSQAYDVNSAPTPDGDNAITGSKPTFTAAGKYAVNYRIVADNHNEYRGQWTVEVIDNTEKLVTVTFNKPYSVEYGEVPESKEQLADMMKALIDGGYVTIDGLDAETFLQVMEMRLSVDNSSSATSDTDVGRYTPYFAIKPEYEATYGGYSIFYKTADHSENTNIGKFEIEQRELEIKWDSIGFVYDGNVHLPKATISGFKDGKTFELALDSAEGKVFKLEADGKTIEVEVSVIGDLTSAGGHTVNIAVNDTNYKVSAPSTTISITTPIQLTVEWDSASYVYDGNLHLPQATIKGFAGGKTFEFTLLTADGGSYSYNYNGATITFNVTVTGSGNKLTDVGVYAVNVTCNSANYVIKNPNSAISITAPRKLVVTWNQTVFEDDGSVHLPKARISGFKDSDPVEIELKTATGGVFQMNVDGKMLVFTVVVEGDSNATLLKDKGNYTLMLSVDSGEYVIENPNATVSIRELISSGKTVDGKITPLMIGILAALGVLLIMIIIAYIVAAKRKPAAAGYGDDDGGFSEPYDDFEAGQE